MLKLAFVGVIPTKMYIKSAPYLHQKSSYLILNMLIFLCFVVNVALLEGAVSVLKILMLN